MRRALRAEKGSLRRVAETHGVRRLGGMQPSLAQFFLAERLQNSIYALHFSCNPAIPTYDFPCLPTRISEVPE